MLSNWLLVASSTVGPFLESATPLSFSLGDVLTWETNGAARIPREFRAGSKGSRANLKRLRNSDFTTRTLRRLLLTTPMKKGKRAIRTLAPFARRNSDPDKLRKEKEAKQILAALLLGFKRGWEVGAGSV